jgi:hypothetical protein
LPQPQALPTSSAAPMPISPVPADRAVPVHYSVPVPLPDPETPPSAAAPGNMDVPVTQERKESRRWDLRNP